MSKSLEVEHDTVLAPFTTIGLGGPTHTLVHCKYEQDIMDAIALARQNNVPFHVLGGGSNTIFPDEGFPGVVAKIELVGISYEEIGEGVCVTAAAGEQWGEFVDAVIERGLAGVECLAGIPGLVGGAPMQNIGAYGQDVSETIEYVDAIHRQTGEKVRFSNKECMFGYRMSRFKSQDADAYIITSVSFLLRKDSKPTVSYEQVKKEIEALYGKESLGAGKEALRKVADVVVSLRKQKSMVIDTTDPHTRSCGSFFTNPIVTAEQMHNLEALADIRGFKEKDGYKISAAALIEFAGFERGQKFGNIGISPNHSLALVNYGGTTKELLQAAHTIQSKVQDMFEVELVIEPVAVSIQD